jgi:amino acid adenylation domain-containing protein
LEAQSGTATLAEGVTSLLAELARVDVKLRVLDGDRIEVTAPVGRLSADLRGRIARHKPALIEWLARGRDASSDQFTLDPIVPDPSSVAQPFPPSDLQMSFLIGSREGLEYHVRPHQYLEVEFDGLDPARFEAAFNRAVQRQKANLVVVRDDMRLEMVRDPGPVRVPVTDLRGLPEEEVQAGIERVRGRMQRRELPLDRWPWLEAHICRYGPDRARLHYNNNNLFNDAVATSRFLASVLHYYEQPDTPLPELELSYRDCVLALAELEESPLGQASKTYWYERLAGWPEAPELPSAPGADPLRRSRLDRRELTLPAHLWSALKRRAGARGLTPTNTCYGVYAEVLAYWSGSRHFLINNMVTHRLPIHPQINEVMGNFSSLYPLEVDWRPVEPFSDRVRRLQGQVMADMQHVYWSGVKVLQALNQVRQTPGRAVCPYAIGSALFVGALDRPVYSLLETPQVVLDCEVWELRDGSLWLVWDVIEAMFPAGLMDAMFEACRAMLTRLAEDDAAWDLPAFDLLPAAQRDQRDTSNSPGPTPPPGLLHDCLAQQASRTPSTVAVVAEDRTLDYAALHRRAELLAQRLTGAGVVPGDLVAVVLPKGWEQAVAVFAILTAGAAYVPVDPGWPAERIRLLLREAAATAVLTTTALRETLNEIADVPVLSIDEMDPTAEVDGEAPVHAVPRRPQDLAYVIYTSGSTGRPKGAMLDHRGPMNTIADINRRFGIGPGDVVFGISSLCFDLSVYDLFGTAAAGATLVLPGPDQTDPSSWLELVDTHRVTVWNSVPALMELFVEAAVAAGASFPSLRTVLLSGDWIPVNLPERIRRIAPHARVISLGGATEASIWSICFPVDRPDPEWVSVPYGKPLANQTWYVLDETGRDAPTWVPGHLYIGGIGVALGYLGDPGRTAASFVDHPRTGERLYRTGDRGRYLPSGDIEFLGRSDLQVKINGFRVEPGEIEHALLAHPDVRQAVVVARASGSGRQLAAFVTGTGNGAGSGAGPDGAELREFLTGRLPGYLIPSYLTVLDRLPYTGNGKLDRRALESLGPQQTRVESGYTPARTAVETALVDIWQEVLAVTPIGVHDDFFVLGGQSFAALRVIGLVAERLGRRIPLGALLERRTIAGLAAVLDRPDTGWSPLVRLHDGDHRPDSAATTGPPLSGLHASTPRPWFLVHPAGGNVLCYRGLAEMLDGPCYGLQAPGPAAGLPALATVEDLAELYVEALLEVQPRGPYLLGGWSSGGVIAFEMAHRLEGRGHQVTRVVVIDSPAPVAPRALDEAGLLLWFLEDLDIGFDIGRVSAADAAALADGPLADRVARALALARASGARAGSPTSTAGGELDGAGLTSSYAVFRGVVQACNSYRPPTIAADLTVLRAKHGQVSEFADHPSDAPHWGWASLTTGATQTAQLPGTHYTLLTEQHVTAVADAIAGGSGQHGRSGGAAGRPEEGCSR